MVNSENAKTKKTYDLREVSDILQTKAHLSISQPYLSSIYINTIKKDLDLQLKSQKISYSEYQQAISGQQPGKQQRITNAQLLELIDFILDRTELYLPFEKATGITNLYTHDKTSNSLTLEGFKKFVLLDQKEIISISEIEDLFDKILETQLNQPQGIHFDGFADGNQQIDENSAEYYESNRTPPSKSREALSFNAFVRFIYSKNNSIFDPRKENIYQNMDKPINEYYINSAKNIYHANFDIMTMTKLAGRNIGNSDQNFPLLYALSRGARYIEIEVWDGEKDPVIIYGPIMNSKLELSDFLNQLKRLAFSLSPFPLFLQIVNHCSVKQSFKMKYILETVLKDYLYFLPPDYKDMQNLPSPNELREKIILIGKLPHAYDEIIKESYTYSDAIQARLQQVIQAGKDSILADHNKGQASQLQSIAVNGTAPTNGFSVVNGTNNGAPNDIHNANTTVNFNQSSQLIFSNLTANPLNSPNRQVSASVQFLNSNNNNANLSVASNKGKGLEDLSLRQQQLSGLPSLQNRSLIASSMTPIDGTLLTPIHALSLHNIGDSLDQEMMEFIMKEELEELTPERIIAIPSKAINTNIDSNSSNLNNNTLLLKPKSTNPSNNQNLQELISESEFIANPNQQLQYFSSVKAIDNFFHKNQEQPPKFKRFLQTKYDEITTDPGKSDDLEKYHLQQQQFFSEQQEILNLDHAQPTRLYNVPVLLGESIEVLTPRDSQLSSKLQIGRQRNGTLESQKYNKEGKNIDENKSQNDAPSGVENGKNTKSNRAEDNHSILKNKPSFKKDSLRLQGLIGNGYTSGSTSNRNPSPQAFQVRCIRDYAPIRASNSIESLFGLYVSKIWEKKPALWEIYEFTQRDLSKDILSKQFLGSVLGSFSSLSSFTRQHLAIGKPRCKTADSINLDPLPLFAQGVQFVLNYFHTFDRGSLMYQSKFQQNGGETSGYVLKPFNQRNHFAYSPKKSPKSPKKQIETLDKIPVSNNQTITKITDASQPFDSKQDNTGAQINQPSENSNNNNNINNDSIIKNNNGKNQSSDSILVPSTSTFPQIFSLNPANLSPNKRQRGSKYLNQATDQDNSIAAQLAYEQEEIDNYSLPNLVHIKIISGYNLSTSAGDKVDPYVELIVEDGQEVLDFKTGFVENNNMKPLWYHDVKFTVNQPLFCFLLFQCINTSTGGLIGWFALPFNCVRQGFRVIPLRDGFFNVIKNSFILCEITIVKCPLPE